MERCCQSRVNNADQDGSVVRLDKYQLQIFTHSKDRFGQSSDISAVTHVLAHSFAQATDFTIPSETSQPLGSLFFKTTTTSGDRLPLCTFKGWLISSHCLFHVCEQTGQSEPHFSVYAEIRYKRKPKTAMNLSCRTWPWPNKTQPIWAQAALTVERCCTAMGHPEPCT